MMRITARIQGSFPGDDGKKTILFILVFLVLDLAVSPWFGHPFDMDVWFKTGQWMLSGQNIYANPVHISYTPLWAYWTAAAFLAYKLSGANCREASLDSRPYFVGVSYLDPPQEKCPA